MNDPVTPLGSPATERVTGAAKPSDATTETKYVVDPPRTSERVAGVTASVKSGPRGAPPVNEVTS